MYIQKYFTGIYEYDGSAWLSISMHVLACISMYVTA